MELNPVLINEIKRSYISMWGERWFLSSNAKDIGTLYLIFALFSGLVGTAFSVLIRLEVQYIADSQLYNYIITAHAIVMIFFMVMPAMIGGFGNFLLPLLVGGPDMAFPRLNSISFWLLAPSLSLFILAIIIENGAGTGWILFPGLSGVQSYSGISVYLAIFAIHLSGISSLLGAMNFITTILNMRSPGIRLHKLALFGWAVVVIAVLLLLSLPVLAGAITMILTDKNYNHCFFEVAGGGDPILYQYFFWFFTNPGICFIFCIIIWFIYLLHISYPKVVKCIMFVIGVVLIVCWYSYIQGPFLCDGTPPGTPTLIPEILGRQEQYDFIFRYRIALNNLLSENNGPIAFTFRDIMVEMDQCFLVGDSEYKLDSLLYHKCGARDISLNTQAIIKYPNGWINTSPILNRIFSQ